MPSAHAPTARLQVNVDTRRIPERDQAEHLRTGGDFVAGDLVGGHEIVRVLGRGGMGTVYLARDTRLGRLVAIKRVMGTDPSFVARFLVEAQATAKCSHENIVVIHDVGAHEGQPFMVLEYLEGDSLSELCREKPLAPDRALDILADVARALEHAHGLGLVHRDLKPENIMLTRTGTVKVLDFGIVNAFDAAESEPDKPAPNPPPKNVRVTIPGRAIGTPPYMSPEQLRGDPVDGRSDLWAMGVMLYELITGTHPLGEDLSHSDFLAFSHIKKGTLLDKAPDRGELGPELLEILRRCLSFDTEERYGDAHELLLAIESCAGANSRLSAEECPYPGLEAFDIDSADRFFGRDADIRRIHSKLRSEPLVAAVGPSGAGKSSLIRAGIAASLLHSNKAEWEFIVLRPGRNALDRLAELATSLSTANDNEHMADRLRAEPGLFGSLLRQRATQSKRKVMLHIDQFEELYTLTAAPEDRRSFTACLLAAADDESSPTRVVISVRSDFLDRCAEDSAFLERVTRGLVFIASLQRSNLREALVRPARLCGYRFEDDSMVDAMLDELETSTSALPLLQFAAGQLWDSRDRDEKVLTLASYREMGGVAGALAAHADQVLRELPVAQQEIAKSVFQRLVTPERTRSIEHLSELVDFSADSETARALVNRLISERLLVARTEGEQPTVEIVHESLIWHWPTLNRWLSETEEDLAFMDQLRTTARQWEDRDRPSGLLWRDAALGEAKLWQQRNPDRDLPPRERAFLSAVFALDERVRRKRRLGIVAALVGMACIAAAAIAASLWIGSTERGARRAAEQARDKAEEALDAKRLAEAERERAQVERTKRFAAESTAKKASSRVQQTEEDLSVTNERLKGALEEQKVEASKAVRARRLAESETLRAQAAERRLVERKKELERLLRKETREKEAAQRKMRELSTELR